MAGDGMLAAADAGDALAAHQDACVAYHRLGAFPHMKRPRMRTAFRLR